MKTRRNLCSCWTSIMLVGNQKPDDAYKKRKKQCFITRHFLMSNLVFVSTWWDSIGLTLAPSYSLSRKKQLWFWCRYHTRTTKKYVKKHIDRKKWKMKRKQSTSPSKKKRTEKHFKDFRDFYATRYLRFKTCCF